MQSVVLLSYECKVRLEYDWLGGLNPVLSSECIQTSCLQEAYACSGRELQSRISFQSMVLLLYGCYVRKEHVWLGGINPVLSNECV